MNIFGSKNEANEVIQKLNFEVTNNWISKLTPQEISMIKEFTRTRTGVVKNEK